MGLDIRINKETEFRVYSWIKETKGILGGGAVSVGKSSDGNMGGGPRKLQWALLRTLSALTFSKNPEEIHTYSLPYIMLCTEGQVSDYKPQPQLTP